MKYYYRIILAAVASLILGVCASAVSQGNLGPDPGTFHDELAINDSIRRAQQGDGEAAFRLSSYYAKVLEDAYLRDEYFDQAVSLEYPPALYAAALRLHLAGGEAHGVLKLMRRAVALGQADSEHLVPILEKEAEKNSGRDGRGPEMREHQAVESSSGDFLLKESELDDCLRRAEKSGDGRAAYRLYTHYDLGLDDAYLGQKYLSLAVALGDPEALYTYAAHLYAAEEATPSVILEIVRRAMAGGRADAGHLVAKLEKVPQPEVSGNGPRSDVPRLKPRLAPDERKKLQDLAEHDGNAAYRVFQHYDTWPDDGHLRTYYLELAIKLECPAALYARALWLRGKARPDVVLEYVRRAVALGEPDTCGLLPSDAGTGKAP